MAYGAPSSTRHEATVECSLELRTLSFFLGVVFGSGFGLRVLGSL